MSVINIVAVIAGCLLVVGLVGCLRAVRNAASTNNEVAKRAQVWGSLFAGILTGAGVTVGVLVLQQWMADANASSVWRASVQSAASIPGFTEAYPLAGLVLSGKDLRDAYLPQAHLEGLRMEDTILRGAQLHGAQLQDADLRGADLSTADLTGANLSGAKLQGARFDRASVEHAASFADAQANAATCWPSGFLGRSISKGIKAKPYDDGQGHKVTIPGHEYPNCLQRS